MLDRTEYVAKVGRHGEILAMVPFKEAHKRRLKVKRQHLGYAEPIISFRQIAAGHYRREAVVIDASGAATFATLI